MTLSEYEKFIVDSSYMGLHDDIYSVIGLCGEAGEVAEWYKKTKLRSKPSTLTEADLRSELGDVQHYVTRLALSHGWTLAEVMQDNVDKLTVRRAT